MNAARVRGLAMALALALQGLATAGEIVWAPTFELGMKKAKAKNLPVMVDLYTDWCGWCKRLDQDVYTNREVKALAASDFVSIKLNPEKDKRNGKLFKVTGYPTIIFTDPSGKELHPIVGYLPAERFLGEMKKALDLFKEQLKAKEAEKGAKAEDKKAE